MLRLIIEIASSEGISIIFINASNVFQTNIISNPKKRVYVSLLNLYLEWFRRKFPNHPRNIQGTKDAGFEWYQLLARIFKELEMNANITCKGVWVWMYNKENSYLALAIDNILNMSTSKEFLKILLEKLAIFYLKSEEENKYHS